MGLLFGLRPSSQGESFLVMPWSTSMVVLTKKKMSRRKAISAMEPALISEELRFILIVLQLTQFPIGSVCY